MNIGNFSNGILGDIYTRQVYVGAEDFQCKLLTRREIIALIKQTYTQIQGDLSFIISNESAITSLINNSANIINAAKTNYSLSYNDSSNELSLKATGGFTYTSSVTITTTKVYDLCNFYDI